MKPLIALPALALIAAGLYFGTQSAEPPLLPMAAQAQDAQADASAAQAAEVQEMTMGEADAPVKLIEYASFTCPHCANFHADVLPQLKADYIDTGKVELIYREVYFDRFGLWAGLVARCGGADKYFGISDMIYERQSEWTDGGSPSEIAQNLRRIGKAAGIGEDELEACLTDQAKAEALVETFQQNQEADDVTSTPSFVIDGEKYSNMPYEQFREILDARLSQSEG